MPASKKRQTTPKNLTKPKAKDRAKAEDKLNNKATKKPKTKQKTLQRPAITDRIDEKPASEQSKVYRGSPSTDNKQPLPMPVTPQQLPSKIHQPLIKTTYNTIWLKRLLVMCGLVILIAIGVFAWSNRQSLLSFVDSNPEVIEKPYHLNITPTPTPSQQELANLTNELENGQGSASAQPSDDPNTAADQLVEQLASQSTASLNQQLSGYIDRLETMGVDVINLQAYQAKVEQALQESDQQSARSWLIEALTHAHKLELLHNYYKK